jgi:TonB family protein
LLLLLSKLIFQMMKIGYVFLASLFALWLCPTASVAQQPCANKLRVALLGFVGSRNDRFTQTLAEKFSAAECVMLLDKAQTQPAMKAVGYNGSINLSVDEARQLGAAIGCDFFIIGKTDAAQRSEQANESHYESVIGVMLVDSRSGALAYFDFILEKAKSGDEAQRKAQQALESHTTIYIEKMLAFRAAQQTYAAPTAEATEEVIDLESATGANITPPEFLHRVKPDYTEAAERADITATVEAKVTFRANGEIGTIDIRRWAGFGLDEATIQAIQQLRFSPARRGSQAVSIRATVRYNFRRITEENGKPKVTEE